MVNLIIHYAMSKLYKIKKTHHIEGAPQTHFWGKLGGLGGLVVDLRLWSELVSPNGFFLNQKCVVLNGGTERNQNELRFRILFCICVFFCGVRRGRLSGCRIAVVASEWSWDSWVAAHHIRLEMVV